MKDDTELGSYSGPVGGISRDDLPQNAADLLVDRPSVFEIQIRPEHVGHGYTLEWTAVEFHPTEQEWRSVDANSGERSGLARTRCGNC